MRRKKKLEESVNQMASILERVAKQQAGAALSEIPPRLDFLRNLVVHLREQGPDWLGWADEIRGDPVKAQEAIEGLEIQIIKGEQILREGLAAFAQTEAGL
jgi:hypothetical protein